MPALVRKLALLDPDKAEDFSVVKTVLVGDHERGELEPISVTLDAQARRAVTVLQDVCDVSLDNALQPPMVALLAEVARRAESDLENHQFDDRDETPTVGPAVGTVDVNVDGVTFERDGLLHYWFRFSGHLIISLSSAISVASVDGGETDEMQGDVFGSCNFSAEFGWVLDEEEAMEGEVCIDDWQTDTSIW